MDEMLPLGLAALAGGCVGLALGAALMLPAYLTATQRADHWRDLAKGWKEQWSEIRKTLADHERVSQRMREFAEARRGETR